MSNELIKRLRDKVNASALYQSLFYDLNLLPEQIGGDLVKWAKVEIIIDHFEQNTIPPSNLLREALRFLPMTEVACGGLKCRQLNCSSCYDEDTVSGFLADSEKLYTRIKSVLTGEK